MGHCICLYHSDFPAIFSIALSLIRLWAKTSTVLFQWLLIKSLLSLIFKGYEGFMLFGWLLFPLHVEIRGTCVTLGYVSVVWE